ncbi:MAG: hypothetical protein H6Q55_2814 [Deltaproteobacteria bacterium]|nr:hypothetical protein [Deltaproteobacteria bacterium]
MINLSAKTKNDLLDLLRMSGGFINAMDGLWFLAVEEARYQGAGEIHARSGKTPEERPRPIRLGHRDDETGH